MSMWRASGWVALAVASSMGWSSGRAMAWAVPDMPGEAHRHDQGGIAAADHPDSLVEMDPRCDLGPPEAALASEAYVPYIVERNRSDSSRPPQQLKEKVKLPGGVSLTVISDACVDSFGREFRFEFGSAKGKRVTETAYWADVVGAELKSLRLSTHVGNDVDDLIAFLGRAAGLRRGDQGIVQCHDLSQPEDGICNWASMGQYRFFIERRNGVMRVSVGIEYSA